MAINPQKLLPPAKISSSIVKAPQSIIKKTNTPSFGSSTLTDNITIIKTKVIQIEDILKGTLASEKKALDQKKRQESGKRREEQEEKLEKKPNAEKAKIKMPSAPKMGIFGWIKKFITNIILGYFAVRLVDHLPKIIPIVKFLGTAADFIINVGGKLLNGLITFIDWGYKAYDATRGFIKNLGGENFAQGFDKFVGAIDTTLFLTSVLAADLALEAATGGDDGGPGREIARKPARVFGRGAARAATRFGLKTIGKGGTKAVLNAVRPLVRNAPLIGGLLEFGISWALGDPLPKAAFRGVGTALLGAVGTAIGGPIGLAIGGYAGGELGGVLYDMFFNNKKPSQKGKVQGKAGGGITRGGKTQGGVRRTIGGVKKKGKYKRELAQKPTKIEIKTDDKNLKETGEQLDKTKYFGPILAITSKIMAKQEPTQKDYENVGLGINLLISKGIEEDQLKGGLVAAFAEGGMVDSDFLEAAEKGSDISNWVAKTFKGEIESNAQKTLRLIKERKDKKDQNKSDPTLTTPDDTLPSGVLTEGQWGPLLDLIAGKESGGNYEAMYPSTTLKGATKMTIADVARRATGAVGKYQQLPQYLVGRAKAAGLNPDKDLYSPENQEKIIINVNIKGRGGERWLKGEISDEQFMQGLSQEFASLPNAQGKFYYSGQRSSMTPEKVKAALSKVKKGGYSQQEIAASKISVGPLGTGKVSSVDQFTAIAKKYGLDLTSSYRRDSGYHGKNRARDYSNDTVGNGTPEQLAFAKYLVQNYGSSLTQLIYTPLGFGIANGKKVGLDYWGPSTNAIHYHHVHVALAKGGRIKKPTYALIGEKGPEFVFDADTTAGLDRLAPGILEKLNIAKTKPQLSSILQSYAGYEQPYAEPEVIEIPVEIPIPVPMGGGSSSGVAFVSIGGGSDPFETLYQGG